VFDAVINAAQPAPPRVRPMSSLLGAVACIGLCSPALASTCAVGTKVEGESLSPNGTIVEIGSERPHVGWYRIVWDWNPKGDWYNPEMWEMHPVGSGTRCTVSPATATPAGSAGDAAPTQAPASASAQQAAPATRAATAARPGEVAAGRYACTAPGAGTFPIRIEDGSSYVDRAGARGSYRYDAGSGEITFDSGSLRDQYSKLLGPGKFGLSSGPTRQFYVVCNLKA
jgi:hypothetical protein